MALDVISNGMGNVSRSSSSTDDDVRLGRGVYRRQAMASSPSSSNDSGEMCGAEAQCIASGISVSTGVELCQIGNETCELPLELFELSDLGSVLSLETWNNCLTDEDRCGLLRFLPPLGPEGLQDTLHDLLGGADFHFGSPLDDLWKRLKSGQCNPREARYSEGLIYLQRKQHYHYLREYHNKMVNNLLEMRKLWELYPEADLSGKVNRWKEYKAQQYGKVVPAPLHHQTSVSPLSQSGVHGRGTAKSFSHAKARPSSQQQQQQQQQQQRPAVGEELAKAGGLKTSFPSVKVRVPAVTVQQPLPQRAAFLPPPGAAPAAPAAASPGHQAFAQTSTASAAGHGGLTESPIITKIPKRSVPSSRKRSEEANASPQRNNHKRQRMGNVDVPSRAVTPSLFIKDPMKLPPQQTNGTSVGKKSPILTIAAPPPSSPAAESGFSNAAAMEGKRGVGPPFSTLHFLGAVRAALLQPAGARIMVPGKPLWWPLCDVAERVRVNSGDKRLASASLGAITEIVRAALHTLAHRPAPAAMKQTRPLVHFDKENKLWAWTAASPVSSLPSDSLGFIQTDADAWGISKKTLMQIDSSFRERLSILKVDELLPPPPPPVPASLSDKERFSTLRAQKSTITILPSTTDMRQYFRMEERHRYSVPDRAFHYTAADGGKAVVAPIRRGGGKPTSKARDHFMLKPDRPPHVTILCLVRDAAARLPDGIGTRADVCALLRDSQYIVEDVSDSQINQVVSGALDRLHYERDPCVKYCGDRKLWMYLHRNRSEADFEVDGTTSTKRWRRPRKDARGARIVENEAQTPSPRIPSPSGDEASGSPHSGIRAITGPPMEPMDSPERVAAQMGNGEEECQAIVAVGSPALDVGYDGRRGAELVLYDGGEAAARPRVFRTPEVGFHKPGSRRGRLGTVPPVANLNRCPPESGSSEEDQRSNAAGGGVGGGGHMRTDSPIQKGVNRGHGRNGVVEGVEAKNAWWNSSSGYGVNWEAAASDPPVSPDDEGTEDDDDDGRRVAHRHHDADELLDAETE